MGGTIGDQGLEEDQIEEDLEPVAHQRKTSHPAVILQQMERMENGKLSVNVNSLFSPSGLLNLRRFFSKCSYFVSIFYNSFLSSFYFIWNGYFTYLLSSQNWK